MKKDRNPYGFHMVAELQSFWEEFLFLLQECFSVFFGLEE